MLENIRVVTDVIDEDSLKDPETIQRKEVKDKIFKNKWITFFFIERKKQYSRAWTENIFIQKFFY